MEWHLISLIFQDPYLLKRYDPKNRSSAQGLFMMMTNGFGAVLGSLLDGLLINILKSFNNTTELAGFQTETTNSK
jgi:NHS family xanthosine MFS transporter